MARRLGRRLAGVTVLLVALFVVGVLFVERDHPSLPDAGPAAEDDEAVLLAGAGELGGGFTMEPVPTASRATLESSPTRRPRKKLRTLTCRVIDPDGNPVQAASVFVRAQTWTFWTDFEQAPIARRHTDSDGRCVFSLPSSQRVVLEAVHEDFAPTRKGTYSVGDDVKLVLRPKRTLWGVVVDTWGDPVSGAKVTASQDRGQASLMAPVVTYATTETDEDGVFVLETERRDMTVHASHAEHYNAVPVHVFADDDHAKATLKLHLREGDALSTTVEDAESGEPIADAEVRCGKTVRTDREGRATLTGIWIHEETHVRVHAEGYAATALPWHHVSGGTVRLERGVEVTGRLIRVNDLPFDVRVSVYRPRDPKHDRRIYSGPLFPKSDGRFRLRVESGAYLVIYARTQGGAYVVRSVDVPWRGGDVGTIDLTDGHAVFGTVRFPPTLSRASIVISPAMPDVSRMEETYARSLRREGTVTAELPGFRFPGLTEPGKYSIRVTAPGWPAVGPVIELGGKDVGPLTIEYPQLSLMRFRLVDNSGKPVVTYASIRGAGLKSAANGWVALHVKPKKDGAPGSPPNDRYRMYVSTRGRSGRGLYMPVTVRHGQKEPIVVPGRRDVVGHAVSVGNHRLYAAKALTVQAWVGKRVVATAKTDRAHGHRFILFDVPPLVDLTAHLEGPPKLGGRQNSVRQGDHQVRIPVGRLR